MRITSINNYKPNFGYDKKLNTELHEKLDKYQDRSWATTLITLDSECNSVENALILEEAKGKS